MKHKSTMNEKIKFKWMTFFAILFMVPLSGASIDIYAPSLPAITDYFHVKDSLVQLTIPTYLLGFGLSQIVFGVLSDTYGRKKVLLTSIFFFCIVTSLAPASTNIYMLLVIRFFQGMFASAASAISKAVISDSFSGETLHKYANYNTICWAAGPVVSPFIGGYLQHYFGWEASFYFLLGYGIVIFISNLLWLPETHTKRTPLNFKRTKQNIKTILSHSIFISSVLLLSLSYSIITLFGVTGPFLIQEVLGYSAVTFGHMAMLLGVAWFMGNLTNRILTSRHHVLYIIRTCLSIALISSITMALLALHWVTLNAIIIPIAIILFFAGIVYPNCLGKCLTLFREMGGTSAATLGAFVSIGSGCLTAAGALLKIHNQMPLAITYIIVLLTCSLVYQIILRPKLLAEQLL